MNLKLRAFAGGRGDRGWFIPRFRGVPVGRGILLQELSGANVGTRMNTIGCSYAHVYLHFLSNGFRAAHCNDVVFSSQVSFALRGGGRRRDSHLHV